MCAAFPLDSIQKPPAIVTRDWSPGDGAKQTANLVVDTAFVIQRLRDRRA